MIDRQNVVKLIDFGIARIFKPTGITDTEFLGTRGYAAPEQFGLFDLGQSDARTDIHALAVTVKQLLGDDYRGRLLPVLERCTSLNPNDRYQSVTDLVHAVKRTRKLQLFKRVASIAAMTVIAFALPQLIELETPSESPSNAIETPDPPLEKPIEIPEPLKHSDSPATFDPIPTIEPVTVPESIPTLAPIALPTPPLNADRTSPTPEIAKRPELSLYINGELTPNRSKHSTAGDIILTDTDGWQNWKRNARGDYIFPADWMAMLRIENHTSRDLIAPHIVIEFENDDNAIAIDLATVKAGQSVDIDIPIANKPALTSDGYGQIAIALEADGEDLPMLIRDIEVNP